MRAKMTQLCNGYKATNVYNVLKPIFWTLNPYFLPYLCRHCPNQIPQKKPGCRKYQFFLHLVFGSLLDSHLAPVHHSVTTIWVATQSVLFYITRLFGSS